MSRKKSKSLAGNRREPVLELYYSKKNRRGAIAMMKGERSYGQARALLPKLGMVITHPDLRLAISGLVKPSNWNEVIIPPFLPPSKSWLQEFGWLAHGFLAEAARLNSFLELRKQFGRAYLLGDYTAARTILSSILAEHGLSLWLAEREFMLIQASTGFEGHKQKLSEIQAGLTNSLAGYLITTSSNRLEPHVTPESFQRSCTKVLEQLRGDNHDVFASWIELHIAPWSFGWLKDKQEMLRHCGGKTLLDRYDRAIKILSCIPTNTIEQSERRLLVAILRDLAFVINDRQLFHLLGILEPDGTHCDARTNEYLDGFDALVAGDYEQCAKLAEELILQEPTCFEFFWLLAKATASSAQPINVSLPEKCIARSIFDQLLQIALNRVAINLPLAELNMLALKLGDNHLGLSVRQFAQYEESGLYDVTAANQMAVQSKIDACSLIGNNESTLAFGAIGISIDKYSSHTSVQLELYGNGASPTEPPSSQVAPIFVSIARAKRLALEDKHVEVLAELDQLAGKDAATAKEMQIHGVVIARLQFEALIGLGQAENAARAVTGHYLHNPNNLRHVPFERLIEGCIVGRWRSLRRLACWPILVGLNEGSEQDVYEAVDDLLIEHECSSPLSIADGTIECSEDELRVILRDILVARVISRGALWNSTAEERRQMRKQLLQKLYSISVADQARVVEELSEIEQAQLLETAYLNIEGPKFELSFSSVNRELAKVFEGTFARYAEYRNYEAKGGMLANEGELLTSAREGTEFKASTKQKVVTSGILLRQILYGVFIHYLLDTGAGINAFLGTRIRHGSLENQLTRVLGAHSLLSLKNAAGVYVCAPLVVERLNNCEPEARDSSIKAYVAFTQTINALIQELIMSVLRIRVPERVLAFFGQQGLKTSELRSDIGLLDFSGLFSEETAKRLEGTDFSSVSSLLSEAERVFVLEANTAFRAVREYFERILVEEVAVALNNLDSAIQIALPEGVARSALRAHIFAAKGEYAQDLKIISTWFSATQSAETGLGSLHDIICMAVRVVHFASNGKLGNLVIGEFQDEEPPTDVGRLMYEVISILLRNVVQHSQVENGQEIHCDHSIKGEGRSLILRSKVCDESAGRELIQRAEDAISRPFDEWALGTAPGGTGFIRIRKLLEQAGFLKVEFAVRLLNEPARFETKIDYWK